MRAGEGGARTEEHDDHGCRLGRRPGIGSAVRRGGALLVCAEAPLSFVSDWAANVTSVCLPIDDGCAAR